MQQSCHLCTCDWITLLWASSLDSCRLFWKAGSGINFVKVCMWTIRTFSISSVNILTVKKQIANDSKTKKKLKSAIVFSCSSPPMLGLDQLSLCLLIPCSAFSCHVVKHAKNWFIPAPPAPAFYRVIPPITAERFCVACRLGLWYFYFSFKAWIWSASIKWRSLQGIWQLCIWQFAKKLGT